MRRITSLLFALGVGVTTALVVQPESLAVCIFAHLQNVPEHEYVTGIIYCHIEPDDYWSCSNIDTETEYNDCISDGTGEGANQRCNQIGLATITSNVYSCGNAIGICNLTSSYTNNGHASYLVGPCP